jgi:GT2 family glycosyltransferase
MSRPPSVELSVVIVNWKTKDLLRPCLRSLLAELRDLAHEIIVVDNASSDGSGAMVREEFPTVALIENVSNVGFPRANNQAVAHCRGRFVLLLNPDTLVEPHAVTRMIDRLKTDTSLGAVGCRLIRPDRSVQYECARNFPNLWNVAFFLTGLTRVFPRSRIVGHWHMTYWDHTDDRLVPCLLGACIMMPRALLETLGGLDEHMYLEDIDLCYRIRQTGRRILFVSDAAIVHYGGMSTERTVEYASYRHVQVAWNALWLFFRKHHGPITAAAYRALVFATTTAGVAGLAAWATVRGWPPGLHERLRKAAALWKWSLRPAALRDTP